MKTIQALDQFEGDIKISPILGGAFIHEIGISQDQESIYLNRRQYIPFILAFIEESGIDKREVIQKLVTEDDVRWLNDLRKWLSFKDSPSCKEAHKKISIKTKPENLERKHCYECGLTIGEINYLQSKFGDKEGEEK